MDSLETGQNRHRKLRNGLTDSLIGPHKRSREDPQGLPETRFAASWKGLTASLNGLYRTSNTDRKTAHGLPRNGTEPPPQAPKRPH